MREILRFQPLYQERVWGGRAFESAFERKLPSEQPIGESWEMVDRPEAQSVVHGGTHDAIGAAFVAGLGWSGNLSLPLILKFFGL